MREAFNIIANYKVNDNEIDGDEVIKTFRAFGYSLSHKEVNKIMDKFDKSGNRKLDFDEFLDAVQD